MLLPDELGDILASVSKPPRRERLPLKRRGRLGDVFHVSRAEYQILINPIHTPERAQEVGNIASGTSEWLLERERAERDTHRRISPIPSLMFCFHPYQRRLAILA